MFGGGIGRGVGARDVRGDGTVIYDAPATGSLVLHELKCLLRAQEGAGQVSVNGGLPLACGAAARRSRRC